MFKKVFSDPEFSIREFKHLILSSRKTVSCRPVKCLIGEITKWPLQTELVLFKFDTGKNDLGEEMVLVYYDSESIRFFR